MVTKEIIKASFIEGAKKLGSKVGVETHERSEMPVIGSGAPIAVGPHPSLPAGHSYQQRGTTIANPKREDREVEAILGKNIYDPKPDPKSKEEIVLNASKLETEVAELKNTLAILLAGQQIGKAQAEAPPIVEVKPEPKPVAEVNMTDLRAIAKEKGITVPVGTSKVKLAEMLK